MNKCDWAFTTEAFMRSHQTFMKKKTFFVKKNQKDPSTKFIRFIDL